MIFLRIFFTAGCLFTIVWLYFLLWNSYSFFTYQYWLALWIFWVLLGLYLLYYILLNLRTQGKSEYINEKEYIGKYKYILSVFPEIDKILNWDKNLKDFLVKKDSLLKKSWWEKSIDDIINLATEIWKIKRKIKLLNSKDLKWLWVIIEKIDNIIDFHDLEVLDYEGQKYLEWMNGISVVAVEKDKNIEKPIILKTMKPWYKYKGKLFKPSKVIVAKPIN